MEEAIADERGAHGEEAPGGAAAEGEGAMLLELLWMVSMAGLLWTVSISGLLQMVSAWGLYGMVWACGRASVAGVPVGMGAGSGLSSSMSSQSCKQ